MSRAAPAVAPAATSVAPPRPLPRLPVIDPARCTGCGRCVGACGPHLLSLEVVRWKKSAVLHEAERCTGCRLCERRCPFGAISMARPAGAQATPSPDFTNSHNPCAQTGEIALAPGDCSDRPQELGLTSASNRGAEASKQLCPAVHLTLVGASVSSEND